MISTMLSSHGDTATCRLQKLLSSATALYSRERARILQEDFQFYFAPQEKRNFMAPFGKVCMKHEFKNAVPGLIEHSIDWTSGSRDMEIGQFSHF